MISNLRFKYMSDRVYSVKQDLSVVSVTVSIICEVTDVNEE